MLQSFRGNLIAAGTNNDNRDIPDNEREKILKIKNENAVYK